MKSRQLLLGLDGDTRAATARHGEKVLSLRGPTDSSIARCGRAAVLGVAAPAFAATAWAVTTLGAHRRSPWQNLDASPLDTLSTAMLSLALAGSPNATVAKENWSAAALSEAHRALTLTYAAASVAVVAIVIALLSASRIATKPALRAR